MTTLLDTIKEFLQSSAFFGVLLTLGAYMFGLWIKKKLKLDIFNPLLIAVVLVIIFLLVTKIDYEDYNIGAKYISYLLTPATVCLAVPLYRQLNALKKHYKAILAGVISGTLTSLGGVLGLSLLFGLSHEQYVTLLPKSITTAIGMDLSRELGGMVTITVAVILITGVIGNIIAQPLSKLFKIEEPIAKGIAIGTSSHAIGTAKALEFGEIEGAMSSLSIAVAGLLTVVLASIFAQFL